MAGTRPSATQVTALSSRARASAGPKSCGAHVSHDSDDRKSNSRASSSTCSPLLLSSHSPSDATTTTTATIHPARPSHSTSLATQHRSAQRRPTDSPFHIAHMTCTSAVRVRAADHPVASARSGAPRETSPLDVGRLCVDGCGASAARVPLVTFEVPSPFPFPFPLHLAM